MQAADPPLGDLGLSGQWYEPQSWSVVDAPRAQHDTVSIEERRRTTHSTITDIEKNSLRTFSDTVTVLVTGQPTLEFSLLLPLVKVDALRFLVRVNIYPNAFMERVPEEMAPSLLTKRKEDIQVCLERYSVGWGCNVGALMRPEGCDEVMNHMRQAREAIIRQLRMLVYIALVSSVDHTQKWSRAHGVAASYKARAKASIKDLRQFAALQRSGTQGLLGVIDDAGRVMKRNGAVPNIVIVPPRTSSLLTIGKPKTVLVPLPSITLAKPGSDEVEVGSIDVPMIDNKIASWEAATFGIDDGEEDINPLARRRVIGEHWPMVAHLPPVLGTKYAVELRTIEVHGETMDTWVPITLQQAYASAGRWNVTGAADHPGFLSIKPIMDRMKEPKIMTVDGVLGSFYDADVVCAGDAWTSPWIAAGGANRATFNELNTPAPRFIMGSAHEVVVGSTQQARLTTTMETVAMAALTEVQRTAIAAGVALIAQIAMGNHAAAIRNGVSTVDTEAFRAYAVAYSDGAVVDSCVDGLPSLTPAGIARARIPASGSIPPYFACWAGMLVLSGMGGDIGEQAKQFVDATRALVEQLKSIMPGSLLLDPRLFACDAAGTFGEPAGTLCDSLFVPLDSVPVVFRGFAEVADRVEAGAATYTPFLCPLSAPGVLNANTWAAWGCVLLTPEHTSEYVANYGVAAPGFTAALGVPKEQIWQRRMRTAITRRILATRRGVAIVMPGLATGVNAHAVGHITAGGMATAVVYNVNREFAGAATDAIVNCRTGALATAIAQADPACASACRLGTVRTQYAGAGPVAALEVGAAGGMHAPGFPLMWGGGGALEAAWAVHGAADGDIAAPPLHGGAMFNVHAHAHGGDLIDDTYGWIIGAIQTYALGRENATTPNNATIINGNDIANLLPVEFVARAIVNNSLTKRIATNGLGTPWARLSGCYLMSANNTACEMAAANAGIYTFPSFMPVRPEVAIDTACAVLMRAGLVTGATMWSCAMTEVGDSIMQQQRRWLNIIWATSAVLASRNVATCRDVSVDGDVTGRDVSFRSPGKDNQHRGDIVMIRLPSTEEVPSTLCMRGTDDHAAAGAMPHYTSAAYYNPDGMFGYGQAATFSGDAHENPVYALSWVHGAQYRGSRSYRGNYRRARADGTMEYIPGIGHFGGYDYPGASAVRMMGATQPWAKASPTGLAPTGMAINVLP
jgi:hypothetical protein